MQLTVHEQVDERRARVEVRLPGGGGKTFSPLLARNIACSLAGHAERGEAVDLGVYLMLTTSIPAGPDEALHFSADLIRAAWGCSAVLSARATCPEWPAEDCTAPVLGQVPSGAEYDLTHADECVIARDCDDDAA